MIIVTDTREQRPYKFKGMSPDDNNIWKITAGLPEGDYLSCPADLRKKGAKQNELTVATGNQRLLTVAKEKCLLIERKSLADLYGTIAHGRDRFVRELDRMQIYGYTVIVIEAEMSQIADPNKHLKHPTQMSPKSVIASLLAWSQRYGIHVFMCPGRVNAELICFRILERWHRDSLPTKKQK